MKKKNQTGREKKMRNTLRGEKQNITTSEIMNKKRVSQSKTKVKTTLKKTAVMRGTALKKTSCLLWTESES